MKYIKKYLNFPLLIILALSLNTSVADEESDLFDKVFKNPGDLKLNYDLAQVQIASKNFKGAAASLERILVRFENETSIQLLLAKVNIQLNNRTDAKRLYNQILKNKNAPVENQQIARQELSLLNINNNDDDEKGNSTWGAYGSLSFSYGETDNARKASYNNSVLLGGATYKSDVTSDPEFFRTSTLDVNLFKEVGDNTRLWAGMNAALKDYNTYNDSDTENWHFRLGVDTPMLGGMTRIMSQGGQMYLNNYKFINYYGINVDHRRMIAPSWLLNTGFGRTNLEFQEYEGILDNTDKAGFSNKFHASLTKSWERFRGDITYTIGDTNAKRQWYSYDTKQFDFSLTTDYGIGVTSFFYTLADNDYGLANANVDPNTVRQDTFVSYGFNYQISLTTLDIPKPKDLIANFKYKWGENRSNINNYKRDNDREWVMTVTKSF